MLQVEKRGFLGKLENSPKLLDLLSQINAFPETSLPNLTLYSGIVT